MMKQTEKLTSSGYFVGKIMLADQATSSPSFPPALLGVGVTSSAVSSLTKAAILGIFTQEYAQLSIMGLSSE